MIKKSVLSSITNLVKTVIAGRTTMYTLGELGFGGLA